MQFALLDDLCIPAIISCEKLDLRVNISGCASYGAFSRNSLIITKGNVMSSPSTQIELKSIEMHAYSFNFLSRLFEIIALLRKSGSVIYKPIEKQSNCNRKSLCFYSS